MKYIMLLFVLISFAYSQEAQTVTIITTDGSEIIGNIIEESDTEYQIKTPAGLTVTIPKSAVFKMGVNAKNGCYFSVYIDKGTN